MRIVLTGGGTAGHVLPNIAITEEVKKIDPACEIFYIGSRGGPEKQICANAGISFKGIFAGKLRRYFSINNFFDLLKIPVGFAQALFILRKLRPKIVFSKGGYVAVPVVIAARALKIPVVIHEADFVSGLANKISSLFADKICVSFPECVVSGNKKMILTGMPVRWGRGQPRLGTGAAAIGDGGSDVIRGFGDKNKPVVLIMGGSLGAKAINRAVWNILPKLLRHANIIHITGKGKSGLKSIHDKLDRYKQTEYANEELADFYAMSSVVVSRAGASAVAEIASLNKPSILIPLGTKASRGEQIENAKYMQSIGASEVIYPDENLEEKLAEKLLTMIDDKKQLAEMSSACHVFGELCRNAARKIAEIICS